MNRKQFQILLVVAVLVVGLGLVVYQRNSATWEGGATDGNKVLSPFSLNDVSRVVIKDNDSTVTLVKKNDAWVVQDRSDYPADFPRISNLIQGLWDLKSVQNVPVGSSQLGRLSLLTPSKGAVGTGTLVELQGNDAKPISALIIGKQFMKKSEQFPTGEGFPAGRYVMPVSGANAASKVSLVSEVLDQTETKPGVWLDKGFVRVDGIQAVTVSGSTPALQWKLSRDSDSAVEWSLADAKPEEKVDTSKVPPFVGLLGSLSFTDILAPDAKPAGFDKPQTFTVETFDHLTYTLKVGAPQGDNYPVTVALSADLPKARTPGKDEKPEDKKRLDDAFTAKSKQLTDKVAKEKAFEARVYLVPRTSIDPLIKGRSELLAEKKAEPSPSPAVGASTAPATSTPAPVAVPPSSSPAHTPVSVTTRPMGLPEAPAAVSPSASPASAAAKHAASGKNKSN